MFFFYTLFAILVLGVIFLALIDSKQIKKEEQFEVATSMSLTTIIKEIQKVEKQIASDKNMIVNEHILLVKLLEALDKKGVINSKELIDQYNKNKSDEVQ